MGMLHNRLEKICAKNPTSLLFARLAEEYLQQGKVKLALDVCRKGLKYRPSYVAGHVVMGKCYLAAGRLEEARQEFHKVLKLDSDHLAAYWHLAHIDLEMGWGELALHSFKRAYILDVFNSELASQIKMLQDVPSASEPVKVEKSVSKDFVLETPAFSLESVEPTDSNENGLAHILQDLEGIYPSETRVERTRRGESVATITLADLYVDQGLIRKAVEVMELVFERSPDNQHIKKRLEELRARNNSLEGSQ